MKLKSNFSSGLDFKPLNQWPDTLPAIALNDELICGFQLADDHPVFEHSSQSLDFNLKLLKSIYPAMTLPELARLIHAASFNKFFETDALLKTYLFHSSSELLHTLELLAHSSLESQNFVSVKKMGPQELLPLHGLSKKQLDFVMQEILKADESKQDSVKRLELLSDLIQMNRELKTLENQSLSSLTELRYPVTKERDQEFKNSQLPWLSQIKTNFKRRGDKAGFEIQFFAGTAAELNKLAQNLSKVAEAWNSKP